MHVAYSPESLIKNTAHEIGFSEVGITDIEPTSHSDDTFERWIAEGKHGEMRYLSGGKDKRNTPALLLEGAKSVVCVALNYHSQSRVARNDQRRRRGQGVFSIYAHGADYHVVVMNMLRELERRLQDFFPNMVSVHCVDTQPISERDFAMKSGVAWLGKNSCVISPNYGSWIFLGELITNLGLKSDQALESLCGSCTRCADACPTGALDEEYVVDATKCISYFTIEKRGDIPHDLRAGIGDNIFGCDICQEVCPYNAVARESTVFADDMRSPLLEMDLEELMEVSDAEFLEHTHLSALRRCKAEGLRRNARIVLQNSADPQSRRK